MTNPTEIKDSLDIELSRHFARNVSRVRQAVALHGNEDLLLLHQKICIEPPFYDRGGILRLSPKGVFVYGVTNGKRIPLSLHTDAFTHSPFLGGNYGYPTDKDGVSLPERDVAALKIVDTYSQHHSFDHIREQPDIPIAAVLDDGTLERKNGSKGLVTEFIAEYTPSAVSHFSSPLVPSYYKPAYGDFPGCDRWSKLNEAEKRGVIEKLIERVERAFLLKTPEVDYRRRFKKGQ